MNLGFQMINISEARKNQITKVRFQTSKPNRYIKPNSHYQNNVATQYMKIWVKFYTLSIQLTPAPQLTQITPKSDVKDQEFGFMNSSFEITYIVT